MKWLALLVCAAAVLLSGCAAQNAYRDAQGLISQRRLEEALPKLEEAVQASPKIAQYRVALIRTREQLASQLLRQAEQARVELKFDMADELYRRILHNDPVNEPAVLGLKAVERERRVEHLFSTAQQNLGQSNGDAAKLQLRALLAEQPSHERARRLLDHLERETARSPAEAALAESYRKKVTLEFKDVALKTVFEVLARSSGLNFLFDKDVRTDQKTSIFLRNSTVEAVVSRLLIANQMAQRVLDENTVLIYPDTPAKQKDYQLLTVRSFFLSNGDAKSIGNTLKTLLKIKEVVVDERLNLLMLRDSPEAIRLAERVVLLQDQPEPEVMLEVEVLEVKRARLVDLGVRWPEQVSFSPLTSSESGTAITLNDLRRLRGDAIGVSVSPLTVSARKNDSDTNILANPRIRTKNKEKARILIGDRVPNITTTSTSTGFISDSVNYIDVGLKLEVEPTVYPDNEIAIKVALEVSNLVNQVQTKSGTLAYQIGTRTAATVLRLRDGENQVLAGLINDEDRRTANKVPLLGEVPLAGRLFGGSNDENIKTEIVLSITPRLIRNVQRPAAALMEFESGTDSGVGGRGAISGDGPVPAPAAQGRVPSEAPKVPAAAGTSSLPSVAPDAAGAGVVATGDVTFRWEGPTQVKLGQRVRIDLVAEALKPIVSLPVALGFDPAVFELVDVEEGDFLSQGGQDTTFEKRVEAGQVLVTLSRSGTEGASSSGRALSLTVRANAVAGATSIRLLTAAPEGAGGAAVTTVLPVPLQVGVSP